MGPGAVPFPLGGLEGHLEEAGVGLNTLSGRGTRTDRLHCLGFERWNGERVFCVR